MIYYSLLVVTVYTIKTNRTLSGNIFRNKTRHFNLLSLTLPDPSDLKCLLPMPNLSSLYFSMVAYMISSRKATIGRFCRYKTEIKVRILSSHDSCFLTLPVRIKLSLFFSATKLQCTRTLVCIQSRTMESVFPEVKSIVLQAKAHTHGSETKQSESKKHQCSDTHKHMLHTHHHVMLTRSALILVAAITVLGETATGVVVMLDTCTITEAICPHLNTSHSNQYIV